MDRAVPAASHLPGIAQNASQFTGGFSRRTVHVVGGWGVASRIGSILRDRTKQEGPRNRGPLAARLDGCGGVQPAVLAAVERGGVRPRFNCAVATVS